MSTPPNDPDAEQFLAALADLPVLDPELVHERIAAGGHTPRDVLECLPDDGIGVGDTSLFFLPANADGDTTLRHRDTWVVSVKYDYDTDGDLDISTHNSEQVARDTHSERVADRLAAGWPDPNQ